MKNDVLSFLVAYFGKHMDRRIKFRHLDAFSAIARASSLKKAADHLNLTQPAISKTLKELENIIGKTLLERNRAGVRLTPEGEIFLQFAEQSTAALRHGLRSIRAENGAAGRLKVGALPSIASNLLPPVALEFVRSNPDTLLEIYEGTHHDLTSRLRSGGIDLVLGRLGRPETMQGLSFRQLYAEEVVVVTARDGAAAAVRELRDLDQFRVLYPPQDSAIRSLVARLLISQGIPLFANRIESASSAFGRALILADPNSVWFISRGVVANDLAEGHLVKLDLDTRATAGPVGMMTRSEEVPTVAVRSFMRLVTRVVTCPPVVPRS